MFTLSRDKSDRKMIIVNNFSSVAYLPPTFED